MVVRCFLIKDKSNFEDIPFGRFIQFHFISTLGTSTRQGWHWNESEKSHFTFFANRWRNKKCDTSHSRDRLVTITSCLVPGTIIVTKSREISRPKRYYFVFWILAIMVTFYPRAFGEIPWRKVQFSRKLK